LKFYWNYELKIYNMCWMQIISTITMDLDIIMHKIYIYICMVLVMFRLLVITFGTSNWIWLLVRPYYFTLYLNLCPLTLVYLIATLMCTGLYPNFLHFLWALTIHSGSAILCYLCANWYYVYKQLHNNNTINAKQSH
jgi:hypothetical protein